MSVEEALKRFRLGRKINKEFLEDLFKPEERRVQSEQMHAQRIEALMVGNDRLELLGYTTAYIDHMIKYPSRTRKIMRAAFLTLYQNYQNN